MEGFKCQVLAFGMEEGGFQETRFAFEDSTQVRQAQHSYLDGVVVESSTIPWHAGGLGFVLACFSHSGRFSSLWSC